MNATMLEKRTSPKKMVTMPTSLLAKFEPASSSASDPESMIWKKTRQFRSESPSTVASGKNQKTDIRTVDMITKAMKNKQSSARKTAIPPFDMKLSNRYCSRCLKETVFCF